MTKSHVMRQRGSDFLDHSVREIFLLQVAAQILKRQHRDRRLVRQRRQWCRGICSDARYRRGKAVAVPGDRLDAAAPGSAVVKDPAKCCDLDIQIAVFDGRSRPDRGDEIGSRDDLPRPIGQHA